MEARYRDFPLGLAECPAHICQWALFKITKVEYVEVPAQTSAPSVVQTVAAQTYKYLQNQSVSDTILNKVLIHNKRQKTRGVT